VRAFCDTLVAGGAPTALIPTPLDGAELNDCTNLVDSAIRVGGGDRLDGWAIWEWPEVFIEAEYHCVWRTPGGELRDLAPLPNGISSRLFLPDPQLVYAGRQINNLRRALDDHPSVHRLIAAWDAHFEVTNKGERAQLHGEVRIPHEELAPVIAEILAAQRAVAARKVAREANTARKVGRNERCPCDSGLKYKKCHGR
jgi:hypothetical protein